MSGTNLSTLYEGYIACLNAQDWARLADFVYEDVHYNGEHVGVTGYQTMLDNDFRQIPDLHFHIQLLVADTATVASRLNFDCTPQGSFLGLQVNGRRIRFSENVFYQYREGKIASVWSVIDNAGIEAQL